jgi:hypothetical protein
VRDGDLVVAAVAFGGESGDERFGFGTVGSGGMPAAAFLAGYRVEAFVDDGVVAVPLAGDVSLHDRSFQRAFRRFRKAVERSVERDR